MTFNFCDFSWGSEMEELTPKVSEEEKEELGAKGAMLWSIQEALEKQTLQIGASACGATAVVDVLKALTVDVAPEEADRCVKTCLRRNEAPLPDYLLSRSEAGECPKSIIQLQSVIFKGLSKSAFKHEFLFVQVQLMLSLSRVQRRRVGGKCQAASFTFTLGEGSSWSPGSHAGSVKVLFPWQPWTCSWLCLMRRRCQMLGTINWFLVWHQMQFSWQILWMLVSDGEEFAFFQKYILKQIQSCMFSSSVSEDILHQRLCSESVLLIRREDVLQRLTPDCCLTDLSEPRWKALDVQGEALHYTCICDDFFSYSFPNSVKCCFF